MTAALYRAGTELLGPAIELWLRRRLARGKEDPARLPERLGRPGRERPPGRLVWLHGASVGEAMSVLPLIDRLLAARDDVSVLLTTGTVTSARLMAERLPRRAFHQFAPVDRPSAVRRFLDHWRPDLALWVESELWPNLVAETARSGAAMALVNARLSERSYRRWRRLGWLIRPMLSAFALTLAQSEADAARLRALGARDVRCFGNLKSAAPPLAADPAQLAELCAALGGRPRWLAASTHPGEEAIAVEVHRRLAPRLPGLLTVIAPRHPERGPELAQALGEGVARRSAGEPPDAGVYLADTMGELGLFYRLCPGVFVGGSLVPHGGQNPLEPARLGSAVLFGPHMRNFAEAEARLLATGARRVGDGPELAEAVGRLLAQPAEATRLGAALAAATAQDSGVLDAVAAALLPMLDARA
jgi:3-deoxy-D-manno-octulosonic-acid transferase